jgi:hypothetical protein
MEVSEIVEVIPSEAITRLLTSDTEGAIEMVDSGELGAGVLTDTWENIPLLVADGKTD